MKEIFDFGIRIFDCQSAAAGGREIENRESKIKNSGNLAPAGLGPPAGCKEIRWGVADSGLGSRTGATSKKRVGRALPRAGATPLAHRRPSRAAGSGADWTAAGFEGGRWLIDLGSAVKPHRNLGNELVGSDSGSGFWAIKWKTHFREGSGSAFKVLGYFLAYCTSRMAVANEAGACITLDVRRLGDRDKRGRARPHGVAARRQFVLFRGGHGEIGIVTTGS